jgi:hypothetical protein
MRKPQELKKIRRTEKLKEEMTKDEKRRKYKEKEKMKEHVLTLRTLNNDQHNRVATNQPW